MHNWNYKKSKINSDIHVMKILKLSIVAMDLNKFLYSKNNETNK